MTISEDVHAAGQQISSAGPDAIGNALNAALNRFVGNRFTAGRGHIVDLAGATSCQFTSVVHTNLAGAEPIEAPSDTVAAVIDVHFDLTLDSLLESYGRIAAAKSLAKTPVPKVKRGPTLHSEWFGRRERPFLLRRSRMRSRA